MTVIEVDGNNVQPLLVDEVQIFNGAYQCGSKPAICSIDQNRSTLLGCRKTLLFILVQGGVPYMFVGQCEPANF